MNFNIKSYLEKRKSSNLELNYKKKVNFEIKYYQVNRFGLKLPIYFNIIIFFISILIIFISFKYFIIQDFAIWPNYNLWNRFFHMILFLLVLFLEIYFLRIYFSKIIYKNNIPDIELTKTCLILPKEIINKNTNLKLDLEDITYIKLNYFPGRHNYNFERKYFKMDSLENDKIFRSLFIYFKNSKIKISANSLDCLKLYNDLENIGLNTQMVNTGFLNKFLLFSTIVFIIYLFNIFISNFY